jgi:hypothetical protein
VTLSERERERFASRRRARLIRRTPPRYVHVAHAPSAIVRGNVVRSSFPARPRLRARCRTGAPIVRGASRNYARGGDASAANAAANAIVSKR